MSSDEFLRSLRRLNKAGESVVTCDAADVDHHLVDFLRILDGDPAFAPVLAQLPSTDFDAWWSSRVELTRHGRHPGLDLPLDEAQRAGLLLTFLRHIETDSFNLSSFRHVVGAGSMKEGTERLRSLVIRPAIEGLLERARDAANMAVPEKRELQAVPLTRVPGKDETRIFLSHRTIDKPRVERYCRALEVVGYEPWLDQDDMHAGQVLHRTIQQGLAHSCAAVFFVTNSFRDERWLRHEIDLAMTYAIERRNKFRVITLVFGKDVAVPEPLQKYIYMHVENDLDGLREILRALPIELGPVRWRSGVVE